MAETKKDPVATSVQAMNHLTALYVVTAQNAHFCHWNVLGPVFEDNHEVFGEIYDALTEKVDVFAEQVRILGEYPMSKLSEYLKEAGLKEYSLPMNAAEMQKALHDDLLNISNQMADLIDATDEDPCTQDIIIEAKRELDKKKWFLRAMLGQK